VQPARRAEGALLLVTLTWGLTFPLIKNGLSVCPPFSFLALRFAIGLALFLPFLARRLPSRAAVVPGVLLAFFLGTSYFAQTWGLQHTASTRSAFITGLSVILVPLFYPVITRRRPGLWPSVGAALAVAGLYLLTAPRGAAFNRGDLATLACAAGYALYIVYLEVASRRHAYEDLLAVQMVFLAAAFVLPGLREGGPRSWGLSLWIPVGATAVILVASLYLQNRFQKDTTATRAAVIFAAEPLFATLFSFLMLGETLALVQWGGGTLILLGILAAEKR